MSEEGMSKEYADASRKAWFLSLLSYGAFHLIGTMFGSGYYSRPFEEWNLSAIVLTALFFVLVSHTWIYRMILWRRIAAGRSDLVMPTSTSEFGEEGQQKWPAVTGMAMFANLLISLVIVFGEVGR